MGSLQYIIQRHLTFCLDHTWSSWTEITTTLTNIVEHLQQLLLFGLRDPITAQSGWNSILPTLTRKGWRNELWGVAERGDLKCKRLHKLLWIRSRRWSCRQKQRKRPHRLYKGLRPWPIGDWHATLLALQVPTPPDKVVHTQPPHYWSLNHKIENR